MIITMKKDATTSDIEHVMKQLKERGLQIHESIGENFNVFGVVGTAVYPFIEEKMTKFKEAAHESHIFH